MNPLFPKPAETLIESLKGQLKEDYEDLLYLTHQEHRLEEHSSDSE